MNDSTVITIQLNFDDLNFIKGLRELAISPASTHVSITAALVTDMVGNRVSPIQETATLQVRNYTGDATPPELVSFNIDLNLDSIFLTFSETIRPESLNLSLVALTDSNTTENSTVTYTLTGGNTTDTDTRFLVIIFNKEDSDQIRFLDQLLTSEDDSFIVLSDGAISDMASNQIEAVTQQVLNFTADRIAPTFLSFDLDLNEGILSLTFSETVRADSLNFSQISFQDQSDRAFAINFYALTNGSSLYSDNTTLVIMLTEDDLNALKRLEPLGVSEETTFIALTRYAVQDTNGNLLVEVPPSFARGVVALTNDTTSPELVSFMFDLNSGEIALTFSETVRAGSLQANQFTLQSSRNDSEDFFTFYNLTSVSSTNSSDGTSVVLTIGLEDLNSLKQLPNLATNFGNTYISFTEDAISDMFGNLIIPLNATEAERTSFFSDDRTPPELESFSFDLNTAELILSFSETVDASSLNISGIVLQPERSVTSTNSSHRLFSVNSTTSSSDGPTLVVDISTDDLNAIKAILDLATSRDNTYLSIDLQTVRDIVGINVVNISSNDALPVSDFQEDTLSPILLAFSLNLTSEILTLTFTETVNASSINLAGFSLHADNTTLFVGGVSLVDSFVLSDNFPTIEVQIDRDELNMIKLRTDLATDDNNTFLRIEANSVVDLAFMPQGILETFQAADELVRDAVSPMLISFSIDLSNGTVILVFDEPVDVDTLSFSEITLQSTQNMSSTGSSSYRLTGGSTNSSNGLEIIIDITIDDLDLIKQDTSLLRNDSTAYISFTSDLVDDMSSNPVVSVPGTNAIEVNLFMEDDIRPRLVEFDLDMNQGLLTLVFSETVDVSTLMSDQITLQSMSVVFNTLAHSHTLVEPVVLDSLVMIRQCSSESVVLIWMR